jgi:phosphatidylglycerol:prolipoprotein diacylglycerol transferase
VPTRRFRFRVWSPGARWSATAPLVGELTVTSFGVLLAVAFLAGYQTIRVRLRELGEPTDLAGDVLLAALVGGMLGAKIYYLFLTWDRTFADPAAAIFSRSGLVWYGGLMGATLAVAWVVRWRGQSFLHIADVAAPGLALAHSIGRIGCFMVGDDYGRPTDSWVGVAFPEGYPPTTAGNLRRDFGADVPAAIPDSTVLEVHPTQLYESALLFLIFLVLWRVRKQPRAAGWLFGVWMILTSAERFLVEFLRAKDDRFMGPFTLAQSISVLVLLVGVSLVASRGRPRPDPTEAPADRSAGRQEQPAESGA